MKRSLYSKLRRHGRTILCNSFKIQGLKWSVTIFQGIKPSLKYTFSDKKVGLLYNLILWLGEGGFWRNVDGHSKGRKWQGIHGDRLMWMNQRPVKLSHNMMHKDENVELGQMVPSTNHRASSKGNKHIWWNCLLKPTWVELFRILEILLTVMCPMCCPQHLHNTTTK